jgi:hypothetical protein
MKQEAEEREAGMVAIVMHYHRFYKTSDGRYIFCQCGQILIRAEGRYREMTIGERIHFENGSDA